MAITTGTANKVLDLLFGQTALSNLSTMYMGLSTTTIQISGTGSTEPSTSGTAYARVAIVNNKTNWGTASAASLANAAAVTFAESTASWGTITYVFLAASGTRGTADIWYYEALSTPKTVQTATTVQFSIGAITVSMTNA
jgi:hypothetical protein